MHELGIDLADRTPQLLTRELAEQADLVVTMGCGDECPYIPGKRYIDWDLEDPADQPIDAFARSATRSPDASKRSSASSSCQAPSALRSTQALVGSSLVLFARRS